MHNPLKLDRRLSRPWLWLGLALLILLSPSEPVLAGVETRLGAFQQSRLIAPDARALDELGWAVAIAGNTAVVGARNADPDLGGGPLANAGAAYIFVRSGSSWILEARLTAKDAKAGDTFGVSAAIDGETVVIGATGSDGENAADAGAAYVFTRAGIQWTQKAKLIAADAAKEDNFGVSVGIDGNTIVVGADGEDPGGYLLEGGAAYVFIQRAGEWSQKAKLMATDPELGDYFGTAVAISGNRIVVGATEANPFGKRGPGKAYLYEGSGNSWWPLAKLTLDDGRSGDYFGKAVALFGQTLVIGAPFADPDLGNGRITNAGAVYVYSPHGGRWEQRAKLTAADAAIFDQFGESVAVDDDRILIGADGAQQAGYSGAGAAYLFEGGDALWTQQTRITGDFVYDDDSFGQAVALSGDYLLVGANGMDPNLLSKAGIAFVFQVGEVTLPETGFAPGKLTFLPLQPSALVYQSLGDLWLEIPALGVQTPIVGVPQGGSGWDVSWLWDQAGYLEGTTFPTRQGNTALVGHAYLPNGTPGPFADLQQLGWGSRVIIHAWGQRYLYEVREVSHLSPDRLDVLKETEKTWLTLITCEGYDKINDSFRQRLIVKAVLTLIESEP